MGQSQEKERNNCYNEGPLRLCSPCTGAPVTTKTALALEVLVVFQPQLGLQRGVNDPTKLGAITGRPLNII